MNHDWLWAYDYWIQVIRTLQFSLLLFMFVIFQIKKLIKKKKDNERVIRNNEYRWLFLGILMQKGKKKQQLLGQQKGITKKKNQHLNYSSITYVWKSVLHKESSPNKYPHILKKVFYWVFWVNIYRKQMNPTSRSITFSPHTRWTHSMERTEQKQVKIGRLPLLWERGFQAKKLVLLNKNWDHPCQHDTTALGNSSPEDK